VTAEEPFNPSEVRYDAEHGVIALPVYDSDAGQVTVTDEVAWTMEKFAEFVFP
jgi:hypothetical protein